VAHSNAGLLAPLVRARTDQPVVFMDAALLPDRGDCTLAPPALHEVLSGLADEQGNLPPWTRWWAPDALAEVIPASLHDPIERSCPRLPLSYLDQVVHAPDGWVDAPNAYLGFATTYAEEQARARGHGWPTHTVEGGHLHFLHEPETVARAVLDLAGSIG